MTADFKDKQWRRLLPRSNGVPRTWLTDHGSLTARLRSRGSCFRVTVLSQRLARPCHDEVLVLRLPVRELALVREVLLWVDDQPRVYARTVIPRQGMRGHWRALSGLGSRPLGAALFADPRVRRGKLHVKRMDSRDGRYHRALRHARVTGVPTLWARRSVFILNGSGLLVTEVFLPAIELLPP